LQRSFFLRLRRHPAAKGFAPSNERSFGKQTQRCTHGGPDCCLRQPRRIGSLGATLHIRKLVAQRTDPAQREFCGDGCHEGMIHSRAGTMRQYVARPRVRWVLQQAGNVNGVTHCDADGFGNRRGHEAIQTWLGSADRHAGGKAQGIFTV